MDSLRLNRADWSSRNIISSSFLLSSPPQPSFADRKFPDRFLSFLLEIHHSPIIIIWFLLSPLIPRLDIPRSHNHRWFLLISSREPSFPDRSLDPIIWFLLSPLQQHHWTLPDRTFPDCTITDGSFSVPL